MIDALAWAQQLKDKKISLTELLKEIDHQAKKLNPQINGLVEWPIEELLSSSQLIIDHR